MKCPKCCFENPEGMMFCGECARFFISRLLEKTMIENQLTLEQELVELWGRYKELLPDVARGY